MQERREEKEQAKKDKLSINRRDVEEDNTRDKQECLFAGWAIFKPHESESDSVEVCSLVSNPQMPIIFLQAVVRKYRDNTRFSSG